MTDIKDKILNHIAQEHEWYKEQTLIIRIRRDKMFKESFIDEWQEIVDAYKTALFYKVYNLMIDKIDIPFEDLYCELEVIELDKIFELDN